MAGYHPPQRAVRAAVLCGARWLEGTFHVPQRHAFDDHLSNPRAFLALTDVVLGGGPPRPFLALRSAVAQVVVPQVPVEALLLAELPNAKLREVTCYLERVALHGSVALLPGVRTSDFLAHQDGFITLRSCRMVPGLGGRTEPLGAVLVNAASVIAVAEDRSGAVAPLATPAPGALRAPA
ncbi:hypothetical protein [Anaeromyxobacter oryzae]|uniref:Uncharacterized protein n=1 Tax=Anaeromyxobacter oryzae TaxID=2918170 RepID=A0ABM7WY31_9BACT|nr:hypothetical protein [Anaeromyxobacter oryzae]BDG04436.1 hypothetical protein AMOR_34320 [Anaeromyxobacter oryzae]